jgi:hypothetical protein
MRNSQLITETRGKIKVRHRETDLWLTLIVYLTNKQQYIMD